MTEEVIKGEVVGQRQSSQFTETGSYNIKDVMSIPILQPPQSRTVYFIKTSLGNYDVSAEYLVLQKGQAVEIVRERKRRFWIFPYDDDYLVYDGRKIPVRVLKAP